MDATMRDLGSHLEPYSCVAPGELAAAATQAERAAAKRREAQRRAATPTAD